MHAIFIPYGIKDCVDIMMRDMQSQKFQLPIHSPDGKETKMQWIQGSLRILPFGVMEYVFPKESMDLVLTTLRLQGCVNGGRFERTSYVSPFKLNMIRKMIKAEPIPKFKTDQQLIWMMENVSIIPIGIRKDGDVLEPPNALLPGWKHEAI